jgi:SAM-dependent methyltransferase
VKVDGADSGPVTNDGCPVEVYAALPPRSEATEIVALLTPGASVLDLGSGTGRLAEPLAEAGFRVVAVDDSAEMLSYLSRAEPVRASIEGLRLDERFDVVVLASHLVNTADDAQRSRFLQTAARHVAPEGRVLVEWHPPEWFDGLVAGESTQGGIDDLTVTLEVQDLTEGLLSARVVYERDGKAWAQPFRARRLTHSDLAGALGQVDLEPDGTLGDDDAWVVARPR